LRTWSRYSGSRGCSSSLARELEEAADGGADSGVAGEGGTTVEIATARHCAKIGAVELLTRRVLRWRNPALLIVRRTTGRAIFRTELRVSDTSTRSKDAKIGGLPIDALDVRQLFHIRPGSRAIILNSACFLMTEVTDLKGSARACKMIEHAQLIDSALCIRDTSCTKPRAVLLHVGAARMRETIANERRSVLGAARIAIGRRTLHTLTRAPADVLAWNVCALLVGGARFAAVVRHIADGPPRIRAVTVPETLHALVSFEIASRRAAPTVGVA